MKTDQQKERQLKIMTGERPDKTMLSDQEIFDRLTALQLSEWLFYKVYLFRENMKARGFKKSPTQND